MRNKMTRADMEAFSKSGVLAELERLWKQDGRAELVQIIEGLAEIRKILLTAPKEVDGSPSTLIYALY